MPITYSVIPKCPKPCYMGLSPVKYARFPSNNSFIFDKCIIPHFFNFVNMNTGIYFHNIQRKRGFDILITGIYLYIYIILYFPFKVQLYGNSRQRKQVHGAFYSYTKLALPLREGGSANVLTQT